MVRWPWLVCYSFGAFVRSASCVVWPKTVVGSCGVPFLAFLVVMVKSVSVLSVHGGCRAEALEKTHDESVVVSFSRYVMLDAFAGCRS